MSSVSDVISTLVQHDSLWLELHNVSKCWAHIIKYIRSGISRACHAVCCDKTVSPVAASDMQSAVCHQQHFTIAHCKQEEDSSTRYCKRDVCDELKVSSLFPGTTGLCCLYCGVYFYYFTLRCFISVYCLYMQYFICHHRE